MANKLFDRLTEKARRANISPNGTKESIDWFRRVVTREGQIPKIDKITEGMRNARFVPGEMITYGYDPKLKERLDFYDEHPLIIFLERKADGWYGLNLHYLPPVVRAQIFEELRYNERNLAAVAQRLSRNEQTKVCLKRYKAKQLTTKPKTIPKDVWEIAIALPYDKFIKENKKKVWQLSKSKRNGRNR